MSRPVQFRGRYMLSILFVDEEPSLLNATKISLAKTGEFCIDTSFSVTEAIRKLETAPYDAIVSIHRMPEIDSVTLIRYIRTRYGRLPVILVADTQTGGEAREALNLGADIFLKKQGDSVIQSAELEHLIRQAVSRWREGGKTTGSYPGNRDIRCLTPSDDPLWPNASYLAGLPDPVVEVDFAREILYANPACMTCLKNLHMPQNPAAFFPEDLDTIIGSLTAGNAGILYREVNVGDARFEESLHLSSGGGAIRIYAHDISRWVRTIDALEQANRKMSRLTGIIRHDIKNKLTGVLGYLELSKESTSDPALIEFLCRAESSAMAIRHQVDFTKDYENLGSTAPSWVNVSSIIADVQKRLDPVAITLSDQSGGISIYADTLVPEVMVVLLDNSLHHGDHVTVIRISGHITADGLALVYEDDGVGIPDEHKEKIFNRVVGKGSGIGLFLAREILSITGITIKENGIPGRGARFEISVPQSGYRIDPEKYHPDG